MVSTHQITNPVTIEQLTALAENMPTEVHRGKGIVTLAAEHQRVLYQYAFRSWEILPIIANDQAPDTLIWIGEHIDLNQLNQLMKEQFKS